MSTAVARGVESWTIRVIRVWIRLVITLMVLLPVAFSADAGRGGRTVPTVTELSSGTPELPRIVSARVVLGTKYGTAVRVSYCFSSLPTDPSTRPSRLHLTVENLQDNLPPLGVGWTVTQRCDTVDHPVGGIQQPYLLRYSVESQTGTWSKQATIRLKELPALNRVPELPRLSARVVTRASGRAIRISYCFRSLPSDPSRRPSRLSVTIGEGLNSRGYEARVSSRCGTVTYPVTWTAASYVLSYVIVSKNGTYSRRGRISVR